MRVNPGLEVPIKLGDFWKQQILQCYKRRLDPDLGDQIIADPFGSVTPGEI